MRATLFVHFCIFALCPVSQLCVSPWSLSLWWVLSPSKEVLSPNPDDVASPLTPTTGLASIGY
jgi:hypothetical protein